MAHEPETPSPAPAAARKRVILLCCEDLRPVACSLEDALRSRGWDVTVEFGADARPWVQRTPPGPPSLRVLCVPGTVDRTLARQMRAALAPDPDADLHILGVDDSPGLVHEIERLAGVRHAPRRSLHAHPRLRDATLIETQIRRERGWLVGATAALSVFAVTLGGIAMAEFSQRSSQHMARSTTPITPIAASILGVDDDTSSSRFDDPVFSAVAPLSPEDWEPLEPLPEEEDEDDLIILDDDEPPPRPRVVEVVAPRLDDPRPAPAPDESITPPDIGEVVTIAAVPESLAMPQGIEPPPGDPTPPEGQLPPGFLPVAGLTVAMPVALTTIDPFADTSITVTATAPLSFATIDPFASSVDTATP